MPPLVEHQGEVRLFEHVMRRIAIDVPLNLSCAVLFAPVLASTRSCARVYTIRARRLDDRGLRRSAFRPEHEYRAGRQTVILMQRSIQFDRRDWQHRSLGLPR